MTSAGETCFQFVAGNDVNNHFVYAGTARKQPFCPRAGLCVGTTRQTIVICCAEWRAQPEKKPQRFLIQCALELLIRRLLSRQSVLTGRYISDWAHRII